MTALTDVNLGMQAANGGNKTPRLKCQISILRSHFTFDAGP